MMRTAYRQAVRQLLELRALHERAGTPERFRTYLDALVEANRRRPSFLDELRRVGSRTRRRRGAPSIGGHGRTADDLPVRRAACGG